VVCSAGRVKTTPEALEVLGASLEPTDRVAMEVSGGSWEVARILEGHVQKVIVVSPDDTGIARARTKTDRLDARALAKLLWQGELDAVVPSRSRSPRRRISAGDAARAGGLRAQRPTADRRDRRGATRDDRRRSARAERAVGRAS
jgi:hypothetical protein